MTTISIHKNDRTLSKVQYLDSFLSLYDDVRQRMFKIPKRRQHSIARPMLKAMNEACTAIMRIESDPATDVKSSAETRLKYIRLAKRKIFAVEKPLYVYWNVCDGKVDPALKEQTNRKHSHITECFNYVLTVLYDMEKQSTKYRAEDDVDGEVKLTYYTDYEIANAQFLSNISALHKMTHSQILKLNTVYRDAEGEILLNCVNDAWYYAVKGNKFNLFSAEQAKKRHDCFSKAVSALYRMDRHLFSVFNTGVYSEDEMRKWSELLVDSLRQLQAVQKSDKARIA